MADDASKNNPAPPAPQPAAPGKGSAPAAPSTKFIEAEVARGHTVLAPTEEQEVVGHKDDGTPRFRFKDREYRPGETVKLPEGEVRHLRRAGFLVDPDAKVADVATGPTLTNVPG